MSDVDVLGDLSFAYRAHSSYSTTLRLVSISSPFQGELVSSLLWYRSTRPLESSSPQPPPSSSLVAAASTMLCPWYEFMLTGGLDNRGAEPSCGYRRCCFGYLNIVTILSSMRLRCVALILPRLINLWPLRKAVTPLPVMARKGRDSLSTDIQSEHTLDDVEECWSFQTALILVG